MTTNNNSTTSINNINKLKEIFSKLSQLRCELNDLLAQEYYFGDMDDATPAQKAALSRQYRDSENPIAAKKRYSEAARKAVATRRERERLNPQTAKANHISAAYKAWTTRKAKTAANN